MSCRKVLAYWRSLIIAAVIAYGCLLRKPPFTVPPIDGGDKWVHWLAFMTLTLVLFWDNHKAQLRPAPTYLIATITPILYGGLIEILQQQFFYPRTAEWLDWLADCIGVLIALVIYTLFRYTYARRRTAQ